MSFRSPLESKLQNRSVIVSGGARRVRTDDLMLAKHALYQLSYGPFFTQRAPHWEHVIRNRGDQVW
jgi:hypothetical protein